MALKKALIERALGAGPSLGYGHGAAKALQRLVSLVLTAGILQVARQLRRHSAT